MNLSTKIDAEKGVARKGATVVAGNARFEVLSPEVIRLEYSTDGSFLNQPTFTVLDRDFPVPAYTETESNGWLQLSTSDVVLRYRLGSGAFSPANTQLQLLHPLQGSSPTVSPTWPGECTYGQTCQSTAAALSGGAVIASDHTGNQSTAGFVAGFGATGSTASWQLLGATAGAAEVTIRYANYIGAIGGPAPRTMSLVVNGTATQVTLPATSSWDDWSTVQVPVTLGSGSNAVDVTCATGDDCNVNIDDIAVTPTGGAATSFTPANPLGGYLRSFDSTNGSYSASPNCGSGQSGATCQAPIPLMAPGLLDKSGWYLLDDTRSDVWTSDGWIAPRPTGDVEDGYLFGYGQNYTSALSDLAKLTGPAPLLPEYLFGNWLSRYYPYSTSDYEDQILPQYQANGVSLDTLSVDTNWKSPNTWDGWEWNPSLFPDPQSFLAWAKAQEIHVDLNIHSSIATNDPEYAEAQDIAGGTLQPGPCGVSGGCAVFDWSNVAQAEANFALQQPLYNAGAAFTWLDWCCDASTVSLPGATPDSWINHLYAQQMVNTGQRGFVLSRIGASLQNSQAGAYPTGAWADHRSAVAFTGDTWSTWNTLAMEAQLAQDETAIGEPYVSDDIGGFLGAPNGGSNDPDDLYLRWLQLGTFQPIMREHSNGVDRGQNARLPWEYDSATQAIGDQFLQLREQLVPYLYTLAQQASSSGLPMTQPLYLDYPDQPAAYDNPTEYLLGQDMLVAPVTTPGQVATTTVWLPPGQWTDWFTGATFQGPSTQTFEVPDSRMPVFVKAGGIVPLQPATGHAQDAGSAPLTLRVFGGADGRYSMYDDAGTGLGYQTRQDTLTPIVFTVDDPSKSTIKIDPARGTYPGAPSSRSYTVDLVDISAPHAVQADGKTLPSSDWSYDAATHTLKVVVGSVPTNHTETITQIGGTAVQAAEPAATALTIDPADSLNVAPGSTTTVSSTFTDSGPGAVDNVQLALNVPAGWQATATTPSTASSLTAGGTLTASWSVTAPASSSGQLQTATLSAAATYTDAVSGQTVTDTAAQVPAPAITSVSPSTASAGQVVTVTGTGFGAKQDGSYLTFSDEGTNWGAPPDAATFSIDSWSDTQITFTVPQPSGDNGVWHVVPGSTATITVTSPLGTVSNTATLTIGN
ncbi:MAG TPA: TIM-barrel domain-containing protein [Actinocrinis sp.]|uniref:TIM-barrel domain-containing protein n=1 Tax=Actinocrinis sp. TaxID=1920516 RepID=UPI002DDD847A|nr:TIM-barrel domain-containing protein [Actinocrinis sp.]HEV3171017.1 TIM-barrel domain-containing protein [Actinocrinis sp.]